MTACPVIAFPPQLQVSALMLDGREFLRVRDQALTTYVELRGAELQPVPLLEDVGPPSPQAIALCERIDDALDRAGREIDVDRALAGTGNVLRLSRTAAQ